MEGSRARDLRHISPACLEGVTLSSSGAVWLLPGGLKVPLTAALALLLTQPSALLCGTLVSRGTQVHVRPENLAYHTAALGLSSAVVAMMALLGGASGPA